MVWFLVVLLMVVVAILLVFRKRWRRNKAIQILLHHSQQLTDQTMATALQTLDFHVAKPLVSKPMTDIWGHGIMAFSYQLPLQTKTLKQQPLEQALQNAAEELDIASSDPALPPFVITDFFVLDGQLHVDVAFITNEATIEYVRDVNRVA
ncbi:hypothetical protein [Lacticaseibacillus chiayiensis]|uniref:hypothetical protein n=1 Tax=Lacticaseibacillus chiayiensis TaxID=2100821 RepID=UPI001011A643|nr:hypothetical protein [Lacticaseibacillus chiayiensis]RXT59209.1 hypothetical protein CHT97_01925 [Lacticaseibacillus chiayiensis]